ncbi:MAG: RluA family pseudouridine synthase [Candidatus Omnitrophica bacterium]|nr:RluA family pseudouridine synthase [Candidatus Omnitrophota bacterium]MDD5552304.1 RluA family pseudouridine synthase [Candidatus Omnitrophota bacterium]
MNIPIVFEDEWLLVLNKPSGLLTVPTPKMESRTLSSILNDDLKERGIAYRLYPCHRLDRETSGLIIYAKGKSIQKKMMDEFRGKTIKKTYIAFLRESPPKDKGRIVCPIEGQNALTEYRVIEKRKGFSVAEAMPLTGRTNQIRIHFKQIGHPLIGESKFAFRRDFKIKAKRAMLHAKKLEFIHPVTRKLLSLKSPLPTDMLDFLKRHEN